MKKNMMRGTNALMALTAITMIASVVTAQEVDNSSTVDAYKYIGAGIALGLCGIGTGIQPEPDRRCRCGHGS